MLERDEVFGLVFGLLVWLAFVAVAIVHAVRIAGLLRAHRRAERAWRLRIATAIGRAARESAGGRQP